jgi:hypothetical protein
MVFLLLHTDAGEKKRFACHFQIQGSRVPMAGDNFCLPDLKVAPLVQVSKQTESEFHRLCKMTIKPRQSLLFAVDPHLAFHIVKNTGLQGWRSDLVSTGCARRARKVVGRLNPVSPSKNANGISSSRCLSR